MANSQSRSRRDHKLWDERVNNLWNGQRPVLSAEESIAAARKLYRHATGKAWPGKWAVTSGNRHTWAYLEDVGKGKLARVFRVNAGKGLRDIIHLMSHYCHRRLHPHDKPHSIRQLRLEARLTKFALARKWHEGTLKSEPKPEPAKADPVVLKYRRAVNRRDKWAKELERAKRLLAVNQRDVKYYEKRYPDRIAG